MNVEDLKELCEQHREQLKSKTGRLVKFCEDGPIGISLIDAIVEILETQQQEIENLKSSQRHDFSNSRQSRFFRATPGIPPQD
jgi:hypothetical protein